MNVVVGNSIVCQDKGVVIKGGRRLRRNPVFKATAGHVRRGKRRRARELAKGVLASLQTAFGDVAGAGKHDVALPQLVKLLERNRLVSSVGEEIYKLFLRAGEICCRKNPTPAKYGGRL
ncbi:hypothetical protein IYX23_00490 [Methylocystis sp. L43]|jgi:hypothetical protein|uniref:Uncharacterized protein n=1 Tax=Methylocystis rosea TaxID=173366 RepID=A0ABX6ELX7_9HYPH|nr:MULTISPECIES: hypothetical protein [Methylocystis]MBG0796192.1 hypothetical protein [Methylocystis sp. L43]MBG0804114.1 hypothetical protein [Methylocystis sp. H15]QGM95832.1 hypothetical protein F7D13_17210 [Methylocystis rosea]